jgi:carbon-monoxide dehydrogenase medium subunit
MKFEYFEPKSLGAATALLAKWAGKSRFLAGGTDLLVRMHDGAWRPEAVINLKRIRGLDAIKNKEGRLWIGARVTLTQVGESPEVAKVLPMLTDTVYDMASCQIRNLATVVGNLCNASPAADLAPPLLCADAWIHAVGEKGARVIPLATFFKGPGQTALEHGELAAWVSIPHSVRDYKGGFTKFTTREGMDLAIVNAAVLARIAGDYLEDVRISLGAVAPVPMRAPGAEAAAKRSPQDFNAVGEEAMNECSPIDDVRGSAWYRKHLVKVLTRRLLEGLKGGAA